jgi:phosphatidylglycerophosphate synthase
LITYSEADTRTFSGALAKTSGVQKTAKGAPAYSRFVNRRLGRYLAAGAFALRMTPNQVTLVSATFSYAAIVTIALVRPSAWMAVGVTVGLVLGYALDSADGQLARLRGGGSVAGEWLDHMVDCAKIASLHLAVLVSFYRFFHLARPVSLFLPGAFELVAIVFFFGTILTDQLRRAQGPAGQPAAAADHHAPLWRSLVVLPTDYGLMCLVFATVAFPRVFMTLYALLFLGTFVFLVAVSVKWYREISAFGRRPVAAPPVP